MARADYSIIVGNYDCIESSPVLLVKPPEIYRAPAAIVYPAHSYIWRVGRHIYIAGAPRYD